MTKEYVTAIVPAIDTLRDLIVKHREEILSEFSVPPGYARRGVGFNMRDTLIEIDHLRDIILLAATPEHMLGAEGKGRVHYLAERKHREQKKD